MSDDLISRKALMEEIQSFRCSITGLRAGKGVLAHAVDEYRKSILQIIEDQPTAFDKEKVIEQIREKLATAILSIAVSIIVAFNAGLMKRLRLSKKAG